MTPPLSRRVTCTQDIYGYSTCDDGYSRTRLGIGIAFVGIFGLILIWAIFIRITNRRRMSAGLAPRGYLCCGGSRFRNQTYAMPTYNVPPFQPQPPQGWNGSQMYGGYNMAPPPPYSASKAAPDQSFPENQTFMPPPGPPPAATLNPGGITQDNQDQAQSTYGNAWLPNNTTNRQTSTSAALPPRYGQHEVTQ